MATVAPSRDAVLGVRDPRTGRMDRLLTVSSAEKTAAKASRLRENQRSLSLDDGASTKLDQASGCESRPGRRRSAR